MEPNTSLFKVEDRERVSKRVLELANSDSRILAGAVVGSLAFNQGDRWSDLDLTFAVADGISIHDVFADWTNILAREFNAIHLFDVPAEASLYRVFLLPGCLQFDLSFTPAAQFGARGPKFKMLFGSAGMKPKLPSPPPADELFGYAVHHALRARFCIERRRYWHAEYWISSTRDYALNLVCRRHGLQTRHGRGFDDLPANTLGGFTDTLVRSLDRDELLRALSCVIACLLREADEVREFATKVEPELRKLVE